MGSQPRAVVNIVPAPSPSVNSSTDADPFDVILSGELSEFQRATLLSALTRVSAISVRHVNAAVAYPWMNWRSASKIISVTCLVFSGAVLIAGAIVPEYFKQAVVISLVFLIATVMVFLSANKTVRNQQVDRASAVISQFVNALIPGVRHQPLRGDDAV